MRMPRFLIAVEFAVDTARFHKDQPPMIRTEHCFLPHLSQYVNATAVPMPYLQKCLCECKEPCRLYRWHV